MMAAPLLLNHYVPFDDEIYVHTLICEMTGGTLPYNGYDLAFVKSSPDAALEKYPYVAEELLAGHTCCFHDDYRGIVCT